MYCSKKAESPFESRPKIPRESPFESKPKLARTVSYINKRPVDDDMVYVDYNPDRGVTFRENRNSDVQIVGIGYNDDQPTIDTRSLNGINKKANDKRKLTKGKGHHTLEVFFGFYVFTILLLLLWTWFDLGIQSAKKKNHAYSGF